MISSRNFDALKYALFGFANVCFLVMVLVAGLDAIAVEGREIEETGWYGQTSVLLFLTCLFGLAKSLVFAGWMHKKSTAVKQDERQTELIEQGGGANV